MDFPRCSNLIYQIGNIFCLEISGGGLRPPPPRICQGGCEGPTAPPCIFYCNIEFIDPEGLIGRSISDKSTQNLGRVAREVDGGGEGVQSAWEERRE